MNRVRTLLLSLALPLTLAGPVAADVLLVDSIESAPAIQTPRAGLTMSGVRQQFGSPAVEQPTVSVNGGPLQPPITRWDYDAFSVIFENDRVVHSVVHRQ
ncbi:MAG TPA: hypothetical protein VM011_12390 [Gammaproteobacteria bacterium]|nr:hypothetical protein [Gammaproteobacteria bacterium]